MAPRPIAIGILLASGIVAGCAGTSPNLNSPQMQTPSLGGSSANSARSAAGLRKGAAAEASLPAPAAIKTVADAFEAPPYLQFGEQPFLGDNAQLTVQWLVPSPTKASEWSVECRPASGGEWRKMDEISVQAVEIDSERKHAVARCVLKDLEPGELFDYRVSKGDQVVFGTRARAPRSSTDLKSRFVVFGDTGVGSAPQKQVAHQITLAKPDYGIVTGDIVYDRGRTSEYRTRFWPIFNAETAGADSGGPVLRSIPLAAAPGNHDIGNKSFDKHPDAYAYFAYWSHPLNGPETAPGGKNVVDVGGTDAHRSALAASLGNRWPRPTHYSMDLGNVHWTFLDSNAYVDWSDPALLNWLDKDLSAARKARWRFVVLHHPPFQSSKEHFNNQWMRTLAPRFEKHRVSVVWSGHVHNYQRTHPLRFVPKGPKDKDGKVDGKLSLDTKYDGQRNTRPSGVLYVVTGAGGASLYEKVEAADGKPMPFTAKMINNTHSLTVVEIDDRKMSVRQIAADGKEIDKFTVTQ